MKEQTIQFRRGVIRNFARLLGVLSAIPATDEFQVTVAPLKKPRSDDQNAALWGVAYRALSDFTGHTPDELHDSFVRAYFGEVEKEVFGKTVVRPVRTTTTDEQGRKRKLSTLEFCNFYAFVQSKGADIGCYVPDPDPMYHLRQEEAA